MIYLGCPYTHRDPWVRNERYEAACRAAVDLIQAGHTVCGPLVISGHALIRFGLPTDWEFWKRHDIEQLEHADELVVLTLAGWETSQGVTAEIEIATRLGKPVRYVSLNATFATCGDPGHEVVLVVGVQTDATRANEGVLGIVQAPPWFS